MKRRNTCTAKGTLNRYLKEAFATLIHFSSSKHDFLCVDHVRFGVHSPEQKMGKHVCVCLVTGTLSSSPQAAVLWEFTGFTSLSQSVSGFKEAEPLGLLIGRQTDRKTGIGLYAT